jgi:hypothetical protein
LKCSSGQEATASGRGGAASACPGEGLAKAGDALREVDRLLKEGYTHVVDADLQGYHRVKPGGMLRQHPA